MQMKNDIHFSKYRWNCTMTDISAIRRAVEMGVAFLESVQLPSGEIPIELSPIPEMTGDCSASVGDHTGCRTRAISRSRFPPARNASRWSVASSVERQTPALRHPL